MLTFAFFFCIHFLVIIMGCSHGKEELDLEAGVSPSPKDSVITTNYSNTQIKNPLKEPDKVDNFSNNKLDKENYEPLSNVVQTTLNHPKYKTKIDSRVTAKYEIKALVGKGSFSDVLRVDCKVTCQPFAVKILKVRNEQEEELLNAELSVLQTFAHRYIIHLEEVIISKDCTYLIMELATGGELYDRIKSRGHLDEAYSCNVTQMILEGLSYLHSHGVTHRDLKPENLLFYHPGKDSKIVITDFGFSKIKTQSLDFKMTTWCGTPEYIAPELLQKVPYSSKVDLWAVGVIVYVMLSGHLPFSADTTPKLLKHIVDCNFNFSREIWNTISSDAKDFISQLLVADPLKRLDAVTASTNKWVRSQPPLHKRNAESKQTQKRQNTRLRLHSNINSVSRLKTKHGLESFEDESSMMSDGSWTNYMKNKASPLYKRQRSSNGNIVLPITGFQGNAITKDAILDDNGSTMSPSNIDSVLATEDSNSQVSSQFGTMQLYYYKNMMAAQTPDEKQRTRQEYLDYMSANELKLPIQLPVVMGPGGAKEPMMAQNGLILPKVGSLKERKISVHDQFENIDEESEDGLESKGMGLTKLDRMYGNSGYTSSVASGGSLKSTQVPVEISNASYIEKVGVWLNDSKDGSSQQHGHKYKPLTTDSILSGRTISQKSGFTNVTGSEHSQASSFNRVVLPRTSSKNKKYSLQSADGTNSFHSHSFYSNATSTTDLLPPAPPSIASSSNGTIPRFMNDPMINIRPGGGSFNSAASYQPLL